MITSAAQFFREAQSRVIIKRVVGNVLCIEEWPEYVAGVRANFDKQGAVEGKDYTIDDQGIQCGAQFVLKPQRHRLQEGTLETRSVGYMFMPLGADTGTWGERKGAKIVDGKLVKDYGTYQITFEII